MIAVARTWFLGTPAGKALGWIGAGLAAAAVIVVAYLRWRATQRAVGASEQKEINREAYDTASATRDDVEARLRRSGDGTADSELRKHWSRPD